MPASHFQAYFGGEARCDAEAGQGDDYDPSELICGACSDVSRAQVGQRLKGFTASCVSPKVKCGRCDDRLG